MRNRLFEINITKGDVMNNMPKEQGGGDSGQRKMSTPNMDVIKGLLAIVFGIIAIVLAYKVIIGVLLLFIGLILLYYGMEALKLTWITKSIDDIIKKVRNVFRL